MTVKLKFNHPSSICICGPSQSGKSELVRAILKANMFDPPIEKTIFSYSENQVLYEIIRKENPGIEFVEGLIDFQTLDPTKRKLLVIDDQHQEVINSAEIAKLFTKFIHHKNLSVILIMHNIFPSGKFARTISLNTQYLILFKSPRDKLQIRILANQIFPYKTDLFKKAFEAATMEPYGYLLVDLTQQMPDALRLRSQIVGARPMIVYIE